ncbi:hypothetical protein Ga0609869_003603 [Rhodovulum iodosum]|uniref:DUF1499 domain-containing protein n=1 Tax=Rhodovulum iodosum TaxID=68291 RepID=A0ABV3XXZ5_9RHOB|nr:hypothetical protein [Rhodovulum robiginosum]RSK38895.1 hypothetical protein EJA01_01735 [Rhodovulum robiginosum]
MAACLALPPPGEAQSVLSFDVADARAPRHPPLLEIDSDGGIAVRMGDGIKRGRMSRADLLHLIEEIVTEQGLPSIDGGAIRRALEAPAGTDGPAQIHAVADAPTSFLSLSLPGCALSVAVEGSAFASAARPDIDALQRFRRIELRLLEIVTSLQQS